MFFFLNPLHSYQSSGSHYHRMLLNLLFWTSLFLLITNGWVEINIRRTGTRNHWIHIVNIFPSPSERGFYGNQYGEWNDSQLQPTIQKLMKGYNRYLRPNFNGKSVSRLIKYRLRIKTWIIIGFVPTEGPVEIGMSLDIASIDAISEINMVLILW